jgi:protein DGCR14
MSSSQELVKRPDGQLMPPPPPPKRIKRPATVLDEDIYTSTLSHIIARDFFPGLLETQSKQEYLDALESKDKEWIASSKKKLADVMRTPTPGSNARRKTDSAGTLLM